MLFVPPFTPIMAPAMSTPLPLKAVSDPSKVLKTLSTRKTKLGHRSTVNHPKTTTPGRSLRTARDQHQGCPTVSHREETS